MRNRKFRYNPLSDDVTEKQKFSYLDSISNNGYTNQINLMQQGASMFGLPFEMLKGQLDNTLLPIINEQIDDLEKKVTEIALQMAVLEAQEQYGVDIKNELYAKFNVPVPNPRRSGRGRRYRNSNLIKIKFNRFEQQDIEEALIDPKSVDLTKSSFSREELERILREVISMLPSAFGSFDSISSRDPLYIKSLEEIATKIEFALRHNRKNPLLDDQVSKGAFVDWAIEYRGYENELHDRESILFGEFSDEKLLRMLKKAKDQAHRYGFYPDDIQSYHYPKTERVVNIITSVNDDGESFGHSVLTLRFSNNKNLHKALDILSGKR